MEIRRIDPDKNTIKEVQNISIEHILELSNTIRKCWYENLCNYGVKAVWNTSNTEEYANTIEDISAKELQLILLLEYRKCFVHKDLISEFVRFHKPSSALDQQARHLGTQQNWYVLNKGAQVPDTEPLIKVPSGYHYLVSIDFGNPKAIRDALKRSGRLGAKTFEHLKIVYNNRCATCGAEEGKKDFRTNEIIHLQQGHMNPRKELTLDNTIPQCQYCNQTYKDYFLFDTEGRVVAVNNPLILLKSPKDIQDEMVKVLLEERQNNNKK